MTASFIVTIVYNIPRFFEIKTITIQSSSDDENVQVSIMNTKILDLSNVYFSRGKQHYHHNSFIYLDDVRTAIGPETKSLLYPGLPDLDENCICGVDSLRCHSSLKYLDGNRVSNFKYFSMSLKNI